MTLTDAFNKVKKGADPELVYNQYITEINKKASDIDNPIGKYPYMVGMIQADIKFLFINNEKKK